MEIGFLSTGIIVLYLQQILLFFKKILFIYSWQTERSRDIDRGRSRSLQGAWCGTRSQDPEIMTWAKGRCSTTEPPRCPSNHFSMSFALCLTNGSIILKPDISHVCSKAGFSWSYLFQGIIGWSEGSLTSNSSSLCAVEVLFISS